MTKELSRISPAAAYCHATAVLSRTDLGSYQRFMDQARRYRLEIVQYLQEGKIFSSRRWFNDERVERGVAHSLGPADLSGMPRFRETGERVSESLRRATTDMLLLVLMNMLFFGGAYLSFLRYDPR